MAPVLLAAKAEELRKIVTSCKMDCTSISVERAIDFWSKNFEEMTATTSSLWCWVDNCPIDKSVFTPRAERGGAERRVCTAAGFTPRAQEVMYLNGFFMLTYLSYEFISK